MLPELLTWKLFVKYLKDKSNSKKKQKSISVWGMIFFHYEKHDTETRQLLLYIWISYLNFISLRNAAN